MIPWLAYRSADIATRVLPARWADSLAGALARLAFTIPLPARRALEANLRHTMPALAGSDVRRSAREAYRHFALTIVDSLRLGRLSEAALSDAVEFEGLEHFERAVAVGRGVILLSAHSGNWEWGAAALTRRGVKVHTMRRAHGDRRVENMFARARAAWGVSKLPRGGMWSAASVLRHRGCVALMADRGLRGRRTSVCAWAALLARRTGAAVVPALMVREAPGRYRARFEPALSPEALHAGGFRAVLQSHVRRHPEQWLAFEPVPDGVA